MTKPPPWCGIGRKASHNGMPVAVSNPMRLLQVTGLPERAAIRWRTIYSSKH
ncbi:hypothetical protein [Paenibacillus chibensis]|uniref:hypothetical protein n=1 Tax=Paenibacillus chibensis TaxID=59846 RepID=UPI0013E2BBE1|nr:hypothetical protein [Paenibacillus chibensis]MEC0372134.1 hypothetical protein [Paenibacillus chibensis]